MEWVECKERLPEETGLYLCVLKMDESDLDLDETNKERFSHQQAECDYHICQFFNEEDNYFHHRSCGYEVTHWMPLPPLPDGREQ